MSSLSHILKLEDKKWKVDNFTILFTLFGILMQGIIYLVSGASALSLLSGAAGIVSVVLCSNRKVGFYFFGFFQLITYVILCAGERLYAEIVENVFYFVTMLFGLRHWISNYDEEEIAVETRKLSQAGVVWIALLTVLSSLIIVNLLLVTNDTQPFMDAITTVPAFTAQILMILRYRESWYFWLFIDVTSAIMWAVAGDWCMVAQFVFWTANCIYGLEKWR